MPVLKIKNNGVWEQVGGIPDHTHVIDDITDFPTALPNPNQLTFTGATEGVYDGTNALTVNIPSAPDIPTPTQDDAGKVPVASESGNYVLQTFEAAKDGKSAYQYAQDGGYAGTEEEFSKKLAAGTLVVEISNNNGTLTANKTYAEIKEAFLNGTTIYFAYAGYHYPLINIDDEFNFWFGLIQVESGGPYINYEYFIIYENSTVGRYYHEVEKFPNPKAITFTGAVNTSYDGSSEMSVEIPDVSGKMSKNNPTGTGSFSLNRKAGSPVGANSHAEGKNTIATGTCSHAEGDSTKASGHYSHAEGGITKASGLYSHAEGHNTEAKDYSHAEGKDTTASGKCSHAEGLSTTASNQSSHAEGEGTTASGKYSHAEGQSTTAASANQHVQGKYNIEDSSGVYADIIGNGSYSKKSNAATVDWSGNAWYAGDVYVGSTSGTNKDAGSKKLATEEYVDNSTASIDIPTTLPNPQSLTFTGAVEGTYDGSSALAVEIPSTPEIPTQLPNPQSLTFTGAVTGSYDGSASLSVNIPSALADLTTDPAHRLVTDTEKSTWNAKAEVSAIPTKVSQLTNDRGYLTSAPVTSVNGKTGAVALTIPSKTSDITNDSDFATNSDVTTGISTHNSSTEAHNDIRLLVQELTNKLNTLADSDDTTLDQLSEIVAYIKNNKSLVDSITTSKVSVSDIIDNLTTSVTNKPLSAKQGVALKALIDAITVPTKVSQLENDNGYLTEHQDISGKIDKPVSGVVGQVLAVKSVDENGKPTEWEAADVSTFPGVTIPIVDSVDEMVDTSKQYILKSTGTIWEWKETTTEKEVTVRNDITSGYERGRLSSGGANSGDVQTHTLTPLIDITKAEYQGKTIQIHLEGNKYFSETNETYIMTAVFDTSKGTIYGRTYSCLDRNAGLLGALDNAGATAEIHSTNSATLTIPVPLTEDTGKSVGYLRFCGLGTVDGTVYITYTENQTVTEETWTDTGVAFGGGGGSIDTETLAKIAELNNEGTDPTTIKLLAKPVLDFYNASAYSDNDYTYSHLSNITYPCRADIPVPFNVKWNHNEDAMRTTVSVDTKAIGTNNFNSMVTFEATGLDNFPIYNLLPNKTYYYKVTHVLADGSLVEAKSGNFTTSNETVRMLYIDGTQNVRDLGGWTGLNGKKIKYGKIIRGASFGDSSYHGLMLTGKGRLALGELKIQAELNLGAVDSETSIAPNVAYKKVYYTNYAIAITNETYRTMFKTLLEYIVSCLDGTLTVNGLSTVPRNIYIHCQGGCDRTGTLSFLLLGLLGVSESDLAKEYELSSFSDVGFGRLRTTTKAVDTYDYVGMVEALKAYSGATITDKFVSFATDCGISNDTITSFRNLMLE